MKQIAVTIPDNKEALFVELMKTISYVKNIETIEQEDIPEWHKTIIDIRVENYKKNPDGYLRWEEVQKKIDLKYGI
jgi:Putative addiction module component